MKKIIILLFALIIYYQMQAQRPLCNPDYTSLSYAGMIPARFPLLKLDMPYETMLHYIWWNDWCHNYDDIETGKYFRKKNFDDEFKEMIKRLYITQDYNPVLFEENLFYNDNLMKTCSYCLNYYLTDRFYNIVPEPHIDCALIESEIIVRIKTTDIVKVKRDSFGLEGYIITSEIQDVIKGKIIPTCKDVSIPETPDEYVRPDPYFQINAPGKCLQFVLNHQFSEDFLKIGKEYIVFINLEPLLNNSFDSFCIDSFNNCYYVPMVTHYPHYSIYYIFPIKNDIVQDNSFLINSGDSPLTYNEWRQKLQEKIDEILNKNYTSVDDNLPNFNNNISVYPNPANSYLNIKLDGKIKYPVSVIIYNSLGVKEIYLDNVQFNSHLYRININDLNSGIYFLLLNDGNNLYSKSFSVIR